MKIGNLVFVSCLGFSIWCLGFAGPAAAGTVDISGRAGIYTPSVPNSSPSLMYGVGANVGITDHLSLRGAVDTTAYTANNVNYTYMPITLDLIYHQTFAGMITPYVGAGVSYNSMTTGNVNTQTAGCQAETGITFALGGFNAGFEVRYLVPDSSKLDKGSVSMNGYMTGSFAQSFKF